MTALSTPTSVFAFAKGRREALTGHRAVTRKVSSATMVALDTLILAASIALAILGRNIIDFGRGATAEGLPIAGVAVGLVWLASLRIFGAYSMPQHTDATEYKRVFTASLVAFGAIGAGCYLLDYPLSRGFFALLALVGIPALVLGRVARGRVLSRLRATGRQQTRVLVVGGMRNVDSVTKVLRREKWLGYQVVGALVDGTQAETKTGLPILGSMRDLTRVIEDTSVASVIFAEGSFDTPADFRRTAWALEEVGVETMVVPTLADVSASRLSVRPMAGLSLVHVDRPRAIAAAQWSKRIFDIIGASMLLLMSAPIMAVVALAIKLEDGGSIFFKQPRVGRNGETFHMIKFRSMCVDAEAKLAALAAQSEGNGVLFKMARDPRVTRIGAFIRRFSIDEIPQFWNAFIGEMSLIGPRPALHSEVAKYDDDAMRRLSVRPGLTGLWQVSGRSDLSWEDTVRLDLYYIDNWSMVQDISILARTAGAVLGSRGAY